MTALEERAHDLRRVEHLIRLKQVQLDQAMARRRAAEKEESAIRTEMTRLDIEKDRLLNGRNS